MRKVVARRVLDDVRIIDIGTTQLNGDAGCRMGKHDDDTLKRMEIQLRRQAARMGLTITPIAIEGLSAGARIR